jgi:hypothetical protein
VGARVRIARITVRVNVQVSNTATVSARGRDKEGARGSEPVPETVPVRNATAAADSARTRSKPGRPRLAKEHLLPRQEVLRLGIGALNQAVGVDGGKGTNLSKAEVGSVVAAAAGQAGKPSNSIAKTKVLA